MATLLIHVISDFLRDSPPAAGQYGEAFRCAVLDDEATALTAYGCTNQQISLLQKRDRQKFLDAVSAEIGAIMDELDQGTGGAVVNYPAGSVRLRDVKVLWSVGNNRNVAIRGDGLAGALTVLTVTFTPAAGGAPTPGTVVGRSCDKDCWQRLYVTATLPAGEYTVTVVSPTNGQDIAKVTVS